MKEEFQLSPDGYHAVTTFIGQLWSMPKLSCEKNPSDYITADAKWQQSLDISCHHAATVMVRKIDEGIMNKYLGVVLTPVFETKEMN